MANKGKPTALGNNPFNQGIFSKTNTDEHSPFAEGANREMAPHSDNLESTIKIKESRFKNKENREAVNLRLPIELNDWLNELLKKGKRQHGAKIPKEVWVMAALELFRAMPVNWEEIESEEKLESVLFNLESRINNIEK